jgi:hypothetical protein
MKQHIWLLDKCKIPLHISGPHERAVLREPSNGLSSISAFRRPFESGRWIDFALDRLSFGYPTAELCYVGPDLDACSSTSSVQPMTVNIQTSTYSRIDSALAASSDSTLKAKHLRRIRLVDKTSGRFRKSFGVSGGKSSG